MKVPILLLLALLAPRQVHRANGQCDEASMLSELISSIHDKPESTSVLVVFNPKRKRQNPKNRAKHPSD